MQRVILTALLAYVIALVIAPFVMKWLRKLKFGQTIYDLGPESHKKKQGTPTMGGVIFTVPALIAAVVMAHNDTRFSWLLIVLVSTVGFGLIGFIDDFIKVKLKRSLGLTPIQKMVPQFVLSVGLAIWAYARADIGSSLTIPFLNIEWNLGWFYIPVMVFVMVGTVNSANLLDGLDGLCGSVSLIDFATMAIICVLLAAKQPDNASNLLNTAILSAAMCGGLMGFLHYNDHPAAVFMGDIGAFLIGGALVGVCLVTRLSLLLPIIALAMLLSTVSDLIQFAYFRATHGKRIFKMAPLHHHFEKCGMPETKIVSMYRLVTIALCLLTLLGFVG